MVATIMCHPDSLLGMKDLPPQLLGMQPAALPQQELPLLKRAALLKVTPLARAAHI